MGKKMNIERTLKAYRNIVESKRCGDDIREIVREEIENERKVKR